MMNKQKQKTRFRRHEGENMEVLFHIYSFMMEMKEGDLGEDIVNLMKAAGCYGQFCAMTGLMDWILRRITEVTDDKSLLHAYKVAKMCNMKLAPSTQAKDPDGRYIVVPAETLFSTLEVCGKEVCRVQCFGEAHDRKGCPIRDAVKEMWMRDDWRDLEKSEGTCIGRLIQWDTWREDMHQ